MSAHHNQQHPAVGAVECPYCGVAKGTPCVTGRFAVVGGQRTETHNARVRVWQRQALPGQPGSVLPPSPVDTDNDCAP